MLVSVGPWYMTVYSILVINIEKASTEADHSLVIVFDSLKVYFDEVALACLGCRIVFLQQVVLLA